LGNHALAEFYPSGFVRDGERLAIGGDGDGKPQLTGGRFEELGEGGER